METVKRCKEHNIKVGAHPGLPDFQGFGGREIKLFPEELEANTRYHAGALKDFLDHEGVLLHHVKLHGIFYGMMCRDCKVAKAVMLGIPKGAPVFGLGGIWKKRQTTWAFRFGQRCTEMSSTAQMLCWSSIGIKSAGSRECQETYHTAT